MEELLKALESCDCGDNSCLFAKDIHGMRTNGGCHCLAGVNQNVRIAIEKMWYARNKRKPNSDGVLPLTDEELEEFFKLANPYVKNDSFPISFFEKVLIEDGYVYADMSRRGEHYVKDDGRHIISTYKAIKYLLDRFDIIEFVTLWR